VRRFSRHRALTPKRKISTQSGRSIQHFAQSLIKPKRKSDKVARGTSLLVIHQAKPRCLPGDTSLRAFLVIQTVLPSEA
jgi:hypothetical protein